MRLYPCGMAVVIASNLRKELAGNLLFDGVSFKLERRDRVPLAGPNGAGKTTLLRMLAGETEIHGGDLAFSKGTRVALHDQRPPLERSTLREYVLSGAADLVPLRRSCVASSRRWLPATTTPRRCAATRMRRPGSSTPAATPGASARPASCAASGSPSPTSTGR